MLTEYGIVMHGKKQYTCMWAFLRDLLGKSKSGHRGRTEFEVNKPYIWVEVREKPHGIARRASYGHLPVFAFEQVLKGFGHRDVVFNEENL
jgi:hypothetical protein